MKVSLGNIKRGKENMGKMHTWNITAICNVRAVESFEQTYVQFCIETGVRESSNWDVAKMKLVYNKVYRDATSDYYEKPDIMEQTYFSIKWNKNCDSVW